MFYQRKIEKELRLQIKTKEIVVLTGMRRTGKTSLMKNIFDSIKSSNKVFFDLENLLNRKIFEEDNYDNIWNNLASHGLSKEKKCYIFLDEIQLMKNIPSVVKYLFDHYEVKFFLTGSSSYYLKNLFSESLSGRKFIFELFPLDFEEFLWFREKKKKFIGEFIAKEKSKNKISHELYKKYYEEYLKFGGFPSVVLEKDHGQKLKILNDIFTSYFKLDVKALADFHNIEKFRDMILLLATRCGTKLEITKIAKELQISRETVYSYLSFLENTYFVFLIKPFSRNTDREISGTKKIYFCDTGMLQMLVNMSSGAVLENSVLNNLKKFGQINYYQRRNGIEIDFIIDKKIAIEVKNQGNRFYYEKTMKVAADLELSEVYIVSQKYCSDEGIILAEDL
jgi:predicted AAA+ superfamily ATPase